MVQERSNRKLQKCSVFLFQFRQLSCTKFLAPPHSIKARPVSSHSVYHIAYLFGPYMLSQTDTILLVFHKQVLRLVVSRMRYICLSCHIMCKEIGAYSFIALKLGFSEGLEKCIIKLIW